MDFYFIVFQIAQSVTQLVASTFVSS